MVDYIHLTAFEQRCQQTIENFSNVIAQSFDARGRKGHRSQRTQTRVRGCIHEEHLLRHHLSDGPQLVHPNRRKLFRRWRAIRREVMQHRDDVLVARHHPGVQIWVPMNGRFLAQPPVERIRIRQHLGVKQVIQTERRCGCV